jgi:ribosomal protein S16
MGIFFKKFSIQEDKKEKEYKILESVGNYNPMTDTPNYSTRSVMTVYSKKDAEELVKKYNKERGVRN